MRSRVNEFAISLGCARACLICLLFVLLVSSGCGRGRSPDVEKVLVSAVYDLPAIADKTGILYRDQRQYLNSGFSMPIRQMASNYPLIFELQVPDRQDQSYRWGPKVFGSGRRYSVSAGTRFWLPEANITDLVLRSMTSSPEWWVDRFNDTKAKKAVPGYGKVSMNMPGFKYPATKQELDEYRRWLTSAIGSEDLLVDGWGHPVKLRLDDKSSSPVLVASSAGPDGKWRTKDDMILRRDTKTGFIIEKTGFGEKSSEPKK